MLDVPTALRLLLIGALTGHVQGSKISFFNDGDCEDFKFDVQGPNGYPDGECTYLKTMGNYSSFMVQRLDKGCDVTIYGPNTAQGICSPSGSIVADIGRCYTDSSWTYYSIDTCVRQNNNGAQASSTDIPTQNSTAAPSSSSGSASATSSSASSQASSSSFSSESNTGAIAGGVIGGVAGLALIIGGAWFLMRRRRRQRATASGPSEMGGDPVLEMSAKEVPKPSELAESRYPRYEAGSEPAPQELPAGGDGVARGVGRDEKPPV